MGRAALPTCGHRPGLSISGLWESASRISGLTVDDTALTRLNRIRNDIEHYHSDQTHDAVREAIAAAFPVVIELFRAIDVAPHERLGESWHAMLEVRDVYRRERDACRKSFERVEWRSATLAEVEFACVECGSGLVEQVEPENESQENLHCRCRLCGNECLGEKAVEGGLASHFEAESYLAMTDGGEQPVSTCPECGLETYLMTEQEAGCAWCDCVLESCGYCATGLTPENVSHDNHGVCAYCDHILRKDD